MLAYYDAHAHLADPRVRPGLDDILETAAAAGVKGILTAAARSHEWPDIVALSGRRIVHGAVGLHPFFIEQWTDRSKEDLRDLLRRHAGIVAVGEIGLDFQGGREGRDKQLEILVEQLTLAAEEGVPVILHNRKSWGEFFDLLRDLRMDCLNGVCHNFCGSTEVARQALDKGLYLSFCGPLTYPNARRIREAAAYAPLDRIMTETDTPDLPVQAHRGGSSRPWHVADIVTELARLKHCSTGDVAAAVEHNFHHLFLHGPRAA